MYQTILLAYNGSAHSAAALRQAVDIARGSDAKLHILGIVVTNGSLALAQASGTLDVLHLERERITKAIETVACKLRDEGMSVVFSVREGDPAQQIIHYATQAKADLVVLGNTNKGMIARWLQGSIGAKLLSHLPCSLLIAEERRLPG
jgi:nucleotide-binding universal stress UspA family protein